MQLCTIYKNVQAVIVIDSKGAIIKWNLAAKKCLDGKNKLQGKH